MNRLSVLRIETAEHLRRSMGPAGLRHLFDVYLQESRRDAESIASAIARRDPDQVTFSAHRLKGGSQTVGAEEVQHYATSMESLSRLGHLEVAQMLISPLTVAIERVAEHVHAMST